MFSRLSLNRKSIVTAIFGDKDMTYFWEARFLPGWLPLLLGLSLGVLLAFLIVNEAWPFAFALLLLVPLVILFNAYPFVTVIIWLLVVPFFARTPTATGRYVYWMFHRALIPVGTGIMVLSHLLKAKKHRPVRLGSAELAMGVYVVWVPISILLFQPYVKSSLISFYDRIFVSFCLYLLMRLTAMSRRDMKVLLVVALVIAISQSVVGLLSWFAPQVLPSQWLHLRGARTTGTFGQPGPYTILLIFAIALLFQGAMNRKPGLLRSIFLFTFGLGVVCVFLSLSRGSWLGGGVVAIGLLILFPKPMMRMAVILLVVTIILSSGLLSAQMAAAGERMEQENTVQSRIGVADSMFTMIKLKPLLGWGYDNQERYSAQFLRRVGNVPIASVNLSSHNTYLTIAAETGLVGFLSHVFPFGWWLLRTIQVLPRMPQKGLRSRSLLIVLWLIIINQAVVGNFIDLRSFPFVLALWWMALGLIANVVFPYLKPGDIGAPRWARRAIESK